VAAVTAQIAGLYVRSDAHGVLLVSSAGISGFTLECADKEKTGSLFLKGDAGEGRTG
jgi:hypothetical protein